MNRPHHPQGPAWARPAVAARAARLARLALPGLALCLTSACYTPRGAFQPVEQYAPPAPGDVKLAVGDMVSVRVFQQEAMSAKVKVRQDGRVSLPLVGEWTMAGKTPALVAEELQVRYKDFVNTPIVSVSLEETRPLQVSVLGEVARPGMVTLEAGAGLYQALAAVGGLTDFAHHDGLFVIRQREGGVGPVRIQFDWNVVARGEGKGATFHLLPGDVVVAE